MLVDCWEQASDGEGQVVLLLGEAGIGKSRVARGLVDHVQPEAHTRLHYQCSPFFSNSPLQPFIEQIERNADFREEDTPEERLMKLEALVAHATEDTVAIASLLAAMLSIPTGKRYPPSTHDPRRQKELTIKALIKYLLGLAQRQPLLIVAEDVHWGDPTTLELLDQLIDRIVSERILLLITFRPEFAAKWYGRSNVTLISLNRLARRQTIELAKGIAGGTELPDEVLNQILEKTDGVPLFVEELTKAVLEGGFLAQTRSDTGSDISQLSVIPATLHDSLLARLDRVPAAKAAAQQAAVIGREFTYGMLVAISPQSEPDLGAELQQLVSSELIFMRGTPPEATYTFKHALVRDAAYESLLKSRRQELHAQIAAVLEEDHPEVTTRQPELVAHHLSEARLPERAITYWQRAADDAASRQAHKEAIARYMRGLEMVRLMNDQKQRNQHELMLQVRLGNSAINAKGWGAAEVGKAFCRARDLCAELDDDQLRHPVLAGLFFFLSMNTELRTAETLGLELLGLGEARNNRVLQVDGHRVLLNARYKLGKFEEAKEHYERGVRLYVESPWPELSIEHLDDPGPHLLVYGSFVLWVLGYPDKARQVVSDAVALARRSGHRLSVAHTVYIAGHLAELAGDWEEVQRSNDETAALAEEWGLMGLRQHVVRRDRLVSVALRCDPEQLDHKRKNPQPGFARSLHEGVIAQALGRTGRPEEGLEIAEVAIRWSEETSSLFFHSELHRIRAGLLVQRGRVDEAERVLGLALTIARKQQARMWELRAGCDLARLWCEQDRRAEAYDLLAPIYGWFTEGFVTMDLQAARAVLDTVSIPPQGLKAGP